MNDNRPSPSRRRRLGIAAGLLVGGTVAAGIVATVLPAAANDTTSSAASLTATAGPGGQPDSSTPVRSDEKALTGTDADKAKAAALAAVPGATVYRVETDADGAVYEAHLTKADGSKATVKLNKDFTVAAVEAGMGTTKDGPGQAPNGVTPTQ